VLSTIAREGPIAPSALAARERLSRPTVTRMVEKLKVAGLVDCTPDPADGRSYLISVTEDGAALRELRHARKNAYVAKLVTKASPAELEVLEQASLVLLRLIDESE
jgi:DNA-binding MarR family transcriptional regulator